MIAGHIHRGYLNDEDKNYHRLAATQGRLTSLFCAWYQVLHRSGLRHQGTTVLQKNSNNGNCCNDIDNNEAKGECANKRPDSRT